MRLLLSYQSAQLFKRNERIHVNSDITTDELIHLISKKLQIKENQLKVTFKRDGLFLKIVKGWNLSIYEVKEGQTLIIQQIFQEKSAKYKDKEKLFAKLGLDAINFRDSSDSTRIQSSNENQSDLLNFVSQSSIDSNEQENNYNQSKKIDLKKLMDFKLESLLRSTKNGNKQEVINNLNDISNTLSQQQKNDFQEQLVNEIGMLGWNPLHFAVYQEHFEIIKIFVEKNGNINKQTNDGWTCLQLAVNRNNQRIVEYLVSLPQIEINLITNRGTALHMASRKGYIKIIQYLIENNADPNLLNDHDQNCLDVCTNKECRKYIKQYINFPSPDTSPIKRKEKQVIRVKKHNLPVRPPVVRGIGYRHGKWLKNIRARYYQLNPDQGTLIRYEQKKDYPLKHLEIIPLSEIKNVQVVSRHWYMNDGIYYFEFNYKNDSFQIGFKNVQTSQIWAFFLQESIKFTIYFEENPDSQDDKMKYYDSEPNADLEIYDDLETDAVNVQKYIDILLSNKSYYEKNKQQNGEKIQQQQQKQQQDKNDQQLIDNISKLKQNDNVSFAQDLKKFNKQNDDQQQQNSLRNSQLSMNTPQFGGISNTYQIPSSRSTSIQNVSTFQEKLSPNLPPIPYNTNSIPEMSLTENDENFDLSYGSPQKINQQQDLPILFSSFDYIRQLGEGAFGKVFLCTKKEDFKNGENLIGQENQFAVKVLQKKKLIREKQIKYAISECEALKMCSHPFVLPLYYSFQTPKNLYMVFQLCQGGDLAQLLMYKVTLEDEEAIFYISQLILAVEHIHSLNIIHRDIKPENLLIDGDGNIKLADFGLCRNNLKKNELAKTQCGSLAYISPEMLKAKGVDKAVDVYGIGTILYEMLTAEPPYYNDDQAIMEKQIKEGELKYPTYVSAKAQNFLRKVLERDPQKRYTIQQCKDDPYFSNIDWVQVENKIYKPPINDFTYLNEQDIDEQEITEQMSIFEKNNSKQLFQDSDYTEQNKCYRRVANFTYVKKIKDQSL